MRHVTENHSVGGSIPSLGTSATESRLIQVRFVYLHVNMLPVAWHLPMDE